ncbi:hypothetical protein OFN63_34155, partial [Escherichia coli]|nr:hypothetical protein [Escherichia coli]
DVAGGMWPPCIMGLILFMARQWVSIFYHIQGNNGRKSSFLAWPANATQPAPRVLWSGENGAE